MKKILLTLFLLCSSFIFNDGNVSIAENKPNSNFESYNTIWEKKIIEMEKEMHMKTLMQYVEFETEIIIPSYFDFKYVEFTYDVANKFGVPHRIAFRLIYKESTFIDDVTSPKGAKGLMQLMPDTRKLYYKELRVDTLNFDKIQEDIYIGTYYLKDLYEFWKERGNQERVLWKLSLAAYNAGSGNVIKYKGVPPYKETQDFVTFILQPHSNPQFFASYSKKYGNEIKNKT